MKNEHIKSQDLKWVGIDFDEVLCNNSGYPNFIPTTPIEGGKEACEKLLSMGLKPVVYTARNWSEYNIVEQWLAEWKIPVKKIICGKPLFKCVIDDRNIEFKGNWKEALGKALKG
jgi:hypothetical protein